MRKVLLEASKRRPTASICHRKTKVKCLAFSSSLKEGEVKMKHNYLLCKGEDNWRVRMWESMGEVEVAEAVSWDEDKWSTLLWWRVKRRDTVQSASVVKCSMSGVAAAAARLATEERRMKEGRPGRRKRQEGRE